MRFLIRPAIILLVAGAACMPERDRCDPDQHYSYGLCYQIDAVVTHDAGPDGSYSHFDDVCADTSECVAPTDFCAKYPTDPSGYCTRTGCLTDIAICPGGWSCLDLAMYGLPAICLKP